MKGDWVLLIAFLLSLPVYLPAHAEQLPAKTEGGADCAQDSAQIQKIHVMPLNPETEDTLLKGLTGDQYIIHRGDEPTGEDILDAQIRDRLFTRAGLLPFVGKFDQTDRDLLYLRIKYKTVNEIRKQYPKIPKDRIQALKQLLETP